MKSILSFTIISLVAGFAQAATLNISGSITDNCVLNQVTPASYSTLNISAGGTAVVAQTDVTCNHQLGYKLRASSANGGKLVNASAPANETSYTMKIYGVGTQNAQSLTTSPLDLVNTGALTAPVTNELRNIEVNVTAVTVPWSGTYSDTVTITLSTL
ncbi:MAG: hypothetical protein ACXVCY_14480 [Pseudobdellovibrionaceae bacterium]